MLEWHRILSLGRTACGGWIPSSVQNFHGFLNASMKLLRKLLLFASHLIPIGLRCCCAELKDSICRHKRLLGLWLFVVVIEVESHS